MGKSSNRPQRLLSRAVLRQAAPPVGLVHDLDPVSILSVVTGRPAELLQRLLGLVELVNELLIYLRLVAALSSIKSSSLG